MDEILKERCVIAPSLICLDLCNLAGQVKILERAGIRVLHIDILDGHFSPSMPLGLETVRQLRKNTDLVFDVHLMATENDFFVDELLDIGVQQLTFHLETEKHADRTLNRIRRASVRTGVALKPATPLTALTYILEKCDVVLLMLINPGYAGAVAEKQAPYSRRKIEDLREMIDRMKSETSVELDGRVSPDDIKLYGGTFANLFVAGSTCIDRNDLAGSISRLLPLEKK